MLLLSVPAVWGATRRPMPTIVLAYSITYAAASLVSVLHIWHGWDAVQGPSMPVSSLPPADTPS